MELFYLSAAVTDDENVVIDREEARHISRVLRHRPGDRVHATDGLGVEYELELREVTPDRVVGVVRSRRNRPREPRCRLTLAQAILKGDGLERIVDGAVQLGVSRFIPVRTKRTVVGLSDLKRSRLRKVAVKAIKSSTGTVLPDIAGPVTLEELVGNPGAYDQCVVAYEDEAERSLGDVLDREAGSTLLIVGPEGGFEPEEISTLEKAGVRAFSLGHRRLRADTAGVVATAAVFQLMGDLGSPGSVKP